MELLSGGEHARRRRTMGAGSAMKMASSARDDDQSAALDRPSSSGSMRSRRSFGQLNRAGAAAAASAADSNRSLRWPSRRVMCGPGRQPAWDEPAAAGRLSGDRIEPVGNRGVVSVVASAACQASTSESPRLLPRRKRGWTAPRRCHCGAVHRRTHQRVTKGDRRHRSTSPACSASRRNPAEAPAPSGIGDEGTVAGRSAAARSSQPGPRRHLADLPR